MWSLRPPEERWNLVRSRELAPNAVVTELVYVSDLKSEFCGFKSHLPHHICLCRWSGARSSKPGYGSSNLSRGARIYLTTANKEYIITLCPDGGIGRHAGLRSQSSGESSSLSLGTTIIGYL